MHILPIKYISKLRLKAVKTLLHVFDLFDHHSDDDQIDPSKMFSTISTTFNLNYFNTTC